jgi:hypothetical protein
MSNGKTIATEDYRGYEIRTVEFKSAVGAVGQDTSTVNYTRLEIHKGGKMISPAASAEDAKNKINTLLDSKK